MRALYIERIWKMLNWSRAWYTGARRSNQTTTRASHAVRVSLAFFWRILKSFANYVTRIVYADKRDATLASHCNTPDFASESRRASTVWLLLLASVNLLFYWHGHVSGRIALPGYSLMSVALDRRSGSIGRTPMNSAKRIPMRKWETEVKRPSKCSRIGNSARYSGEKKR